MKEEEVVKVVTCLSVLPQGYKFVHQAMCNELQQWAMLTKKDGRAQRYPWTADGTKCLYTISTTVSRISYNLVGLMPWDPFIVNL